LGGGLKDPRSVKGNRTKGGADFLRVWCIYVRGEEKTRGQGNKVRVGNRGRGCWAGALSFEVTLDVRGKNAFQYFHGGAREGRVESIEKDSDEDAEAGG